MTAAAALHLAADGKIKKNILEPPCCTSSSSRERGAVIGGGEICNCVIEVCVQLDDMTRLKRSFGNTTKLYTA